MNDDTTVLNGLEDTRQALIALLEGTRSSFQLYTPYPDPRLYDDPQWVDCLRGRIVARPSLRCQFLLPPAAQWRSGCPRLLELAERLSTAIELRTPPRGEPQERPEFTQSFAIADRSRLLHLIDPRGFVGSVRWSRSGDTRRLLNFLAEIWEKSQPDPELRRLGI